MGIEQFNDPMLIMFGKLLLAAFLGALVGTERGVVARQAAGTRTFGLVSLGACLLILTSSYVDITYMGYTQFDPTRVAAAIVQGIGFIGAGIMIFRGSTVHGITTAAGLWVAAALGIAVGFGLYAIAIFTTVIMLIVLFGMWHVEQHFKKEFSEVSE
ncbi:hypothetical protein A2673_01070 [Candidatus Kaiserbacteria bacterium RIFCSPHIGHO2_01_FULL_50_13]|uniref:MgtC/SapB/SrpB/YhiD N-terminal domain-containing protein n=1 Tax=Candidatus Kaiserbacteria bacterium RIFCSPLOWO2_01_FULL_50_24 TaxID=1798507 RepID=A0A1F6EMR9_9BACT|nr:MAG: hypothetical protein A2673_01070 [Candidatus Kaiserbacteria bacterium RIFCSPHIGHO2_01_FULL_50_13]OGG74933.1 MAG: hypothetical protein A3A34_03900 [Candidatus Kaiserbacteria bacterium RIFCSPLOWO2_01_FULL_50_24]OGG81735.1 MAG: hypothetical protein A3H74_00975 [Candidatus Kaiserbacteria bacterium RIFCSPLOWO2_02_FULL_51_13]